MPLKIVAGNIRVRELLEVLDIFFCFFRGAGIIRGGTLLEVLRYAKHDPIGTIFNRESPNLLRRKRLRAGDQQGVSSAMV